jgi:hypothetical protein
MEFQHRNKLVPNGKLLTPNALSLGRALCPELIWTAYMATPDGHLI